MLLTQEVQYSDLRLLSLYAAEIGTCELRQSMMKPVLYRIRVKNHLERTWLQWFDGLTVTHEDQGHTVISGMVRDQAELLGLLMKIRDLGLTLFSVHRVEDEKEDNNEPDQSNDQ